MGTRAKLRAVGKDEPVKKNKKNKKGRKHKWGKKRSRRVRIRKTGLGYGVFSRKALARHAIVGEVDGWIMGAEYESDYCMDLGDDAVLEPAAPFRYLNHSCDPNCELLLWKKRKVGGRKFSRLWLQARRKIRKGEELTIGYAWPAESAIPCHCGSERCLGWIVDEDELAGVREVLESA